MKRAESWRDKKLTKKMKRGRGVVSRQALRRLRKIRNRLVRAARGTEKMHTVRGLASTGRAL